MNVSRSNEPRPLDVVPSFELRIVMASDPRFLSVVRHAIAALAEVLGSSEAESRATVLAIDEALTNVIRHAYHGEDNRPIKLACTARGLRLDLRITDQGEAPDMTRICAHDPAAPEPGGRGTHVIRDVMDVVSYERTREGNRLTLRKEFSRHA
jgi:anti-sigma regulatory factor (Ser/Thr protein kinase)